MKNKTIANNKDHLKLLIKARVEKYGEKCDLNHIDVSKITDLNFLFTTSEFNGDISGWDVSNVTSMISLFNASQFNGDISNWNTSNVTNMYSLFKKSKFTGDISSWRPLKLESTTDMFLNCTTPIPYWMGENNEEVVKKIESYNLFNKINKDLEVKNSNGNKKMKI